MAKDIKVYVENNNYPIRKMFDERKGYAVVNDTRDADMIVFSGGSDVTPVLYGQLPIAGTHCDPVRDALCVHMFREAVRKGKMIAGICRGAQFLNVMNGGSLWQDVNHHTSTHEMWDMTNRGYNAIRTSSTHHQMIRPHTSGFVLAAAYEATVFKDQYIKIDNIGKKTQQDGWQYVEEVEVMWYPDTNSFLMQGHPEHAGSQFDELRAYFFDSMEQCFNGKFQDMMDKALAPKEA